MVAAARRRREAAVG